MASLKPWLKLLRPGNGAISLAGTVIGGLSVLGLTDAHIGSYVIALVLAAVTTFLSTSAGNVLNDYVDAEGDKVNHPDRPIPTGEVTRAGALRYAVALYVASPLFLFPRLALAVTERRGAAHDTGSWSLCLDGGYD